MRTERDTWALVLAAGEGTRLRSLTTTDTGVSIPKQFCSLRGGPSLLQEALDRAQALTSTHAICAVVAAQHRRWWSPQLATLQPENIFVQPRNRGTANGILLPLLSLFERDPGARIVLLPSDHHVCEEAVLARAMRRALAQLGRRSGETFLLGLEPEDADPQLGYIVPGEPDEHGNRRVAQFVEKPTPALARKLIGEGALWNSFIIASTAAALLGLFMRRIPEVVIAMHAALRAEPTSTPQGGAIARFYERLPTADFSRDILAAQSCYLRVMPVPACGWSDLGTPERVVRALHTSPRETLDEGSGFTASHLSLAAQHRRLQEMGDGMQRAEAASS